MSSGPRSLHLCFPSVCGGGWDRETAEDLLLGVDDGEVSFGISVITELCFKNFKTVLLSF